jgi:hypothetical protein
MGQSAHDLGEKRSRREKPDMYWLLRAIGTLLSSVSRLLASEPQMMILDEIAPWFGSRGRKQRKGKERKGKESKLLSFAFLYFSESGLFKELQRIKIKKSFAASAGAKSGARALSIVSLEVLR